MDEGDVAAGFEVCTVTSSKNSYSKLRPRSAAVFILQRGKVQ